MSVIVHTYKYILILGYRSKLTYSETQKVKELQILEI